MTTTDDAAQFRKWREEEERKKRDREEWLAALKAGDEVATPRGAWGMGAQWAIEIVERVTATQIVLPRGRRYTRESGYARGHSGRLEPVTQEVRDDVERGDLRTWLSSLDRKPPTLAQLRAMKAAFDAEAAK